MASSDDPVNSAAGNDRPSLFAQFEDKYPAGGEASDQPSRRRVRPLATRRAYDPRRLWATVLSCLALALAVAGWQWCLILTSDDRLSGWPVERAVESTAEDSVAASVPLPSKKAPAGLALVVADLSSEYDKLSAVRDSLRQQKTPRDRSPALSQEFSEPQEVALLGFDREPPPRPITGERPRPLTGSVKRVDRRLARAFADKTAFGDKTAPVTTADRAAEPAEAVAETTPRSASLPSASQQASFQKAVKLHGPQPAYPASAARTGRAGSVLLEAHIDAAGAVSQITTLESADTDFEQAARQALSVWRFEPAQRDGVAVEDVHHVRFRFEAPQPQTASVTRPPVKVLAPLPTYPPAAFAANTRGEVKLRVRVDETGDVDGVEIVEGLPHGVNEAVLAAVGQWKFRPALQNGQPVVSYEHLTFRF